MTRSGKTPEGFGFDQAVRREVNPMVHKPWVARLLFPFCVGLVGCMTPPDARYVYQDGQYGVIGIPRNTPLGKKDYRAQAIELMTHHFPEGFEIVRAEEVVEGERTLDTARKVELDSEPAIAALNQMIRIGKFAKSESLDQKDSIKITESRILYRKKPEGPGAGRDGFSSMASLSPELYLDPNKEIREGIREALLAKKEGSKLEVKAKLLVEAKSKADPEPKEGSLDPGVLKAEHKGP